MSAGACITGVQRALLEPPVVQSFHEHVRTPLEESGFIVDVHLAIVLPDSSMAKAANLTRLREQADAAYRARSMSLLPMSETKAWFGRSTRSECAVRANRTWANRHGDVSVLLQWVAIRRCFDAVLETEQLRGRYEWLLRLRTDMVYYADVPLLRNLSTTSAYVSSSGMTDDPLYRCMNDQIFLCPRQLCRPYFALLELWESPYCNATQATANIFATSQSEPNGAASAPGAPYLLPLPPPEKHRAHMSAQWYFFARYSVTHGHPCRPFERTEQCCGMLREVAWPYSIARGRTSLECQFRLGDYPARRPIDKDFKQRPSFYVNASLFKQRCRLLQARWRSSRWRRTYVPPFQLTSQSIPVMAPALHATAHPSKRLAKRITEATFEYRAAHEQCNATKLPAEFKWERESAHKCMANVTFGCHDASTLWLAGGCRGRFLCPAAARTIVSNSRTPRTRAAHGFCKVGTAWELLAAEWRKDPEVDAAPAETKLPPALLLGAMLNLSSSPYLANGAARHQIKSSEQHVLKALKRYRKRTVTSAVDNFLHAAAARKLISSGQLEVHLVHNVAGEPPGSVEDFRGVKLHHIASMPTYNSMPHATARPIPAQDARWDAYLQVLGSIDLPQTACVFAVDFSDVRVLNDLRQLCASHAPETLFVSTDLCHVNAPARVLLKRQINESNFAASMGLMSMLHRPPQRDVPSIVHNCGIWGARYPTFIKLARELAVRTQRHYDTMVGDALPTNVIDMLLVNEMAIRYSEGPIVRGWPFGSVNVPFWGEVCGAARYWCKLTNGAGVKALRQAINEHSLRNGFGQAPFNGSRPRRLYSASSQPRSRAKYFSRHGALRETEHAPCDVKDMLAAMQTRMFFAHKLGCGKSIRC